MSEMSPRARQVLSAARADPPRLSRQARARLKLAVVSAVSFPASAAAVPLLKVVLSWAASTSGLIVCATVAAVVGSGTTYALMTTVAQRRAPSPAALRDRPRPRATAAPAVPPTAVRLTAEADPVAPAAPAPRPVPTKRRPLEEGPRSPASIPLERSPAALQPPFEASAARSAESRPAGRATGVREELELLGKAMAWHEADDEARALAVLDEYDSAFPAGELVGEAGALRVFALCALGRSDEARRVAQRVRASTPDSPAVRRMSGSCAGP